MGCFSYSLLRGTRLNRSNSGRRLLMGGRPNICMAGLALACFVISGLLIGIPGSLNSQTPADDIAAQIRIQGYRCDQPVTAGRDVRLSRPDLPVWTLKCRNAAYRVRLDPDMTAHVAKLKK